MSKCVALLRWILLVAPLILHESADAVVSFPARYAVIKAHDESSSYCKALAPDSLNIEKVASVRACNDAFKALDATKENPCKGWIDAKCRVLAGAEHQQCSCTMPGSGNSSGATKSYQECAKNVLPPPKSSTTPNKTGGQENTQYGCEFCGSYYGESSRTQMKKKRTFDCDMCFSKFPNREGLRNHRKNDH